MNFLSLVPALIFFVISILFWENAAHNIAKRGGYVCGAFGAAELISTIFGTIVNFIFSLILMYIFKRKKYFQS